MTSGPNDCQQQTASTASAPDKLDPSNTSGYKLETDWQKPLKDLNLRAILCLIYPLMLGGICCTGVFMSVTESEWREQVYFVDYDYMQTFSLFEEDLEKPVGTVLDPDDLDLTESGHQELITQLDILREYQFEDVKATGLMFEPYDDRKLQGIYGEPVRLVFKADGPHSQLHIHMFGPNGKDDGGAGDDLLAMPFEFSSKWHDYIQPFQEANSRRITLRHFAWSVPATILFALFFYFVIGRNIWLLYYLHPDREPLKKEKYSITHWLRFLLTVAYTSCIYTYLTTPTVSRMLDFNQGYAIALISSYITTSTIYIISFFALPIYGILMLVKIKKRHRRNGLLDKGHCPRCDYDLRESISAHFNCPECGLTLHCQNQAAASTVSESDNAAA